MRIWLFFVYDFAEIAARWKGRQIPLVITIIIDYGFGSGWMRPAKDRANKIPQQIGGNEGKKSYLPSETVDYLCVLPL